MQECFCVLGVSESPAFSQECTVELAKRQSLFEGTGHCGVSVFGDDTGLPTRRAYPREFIVLQVAEMGRRALM